MSEHTLGGLQGMRNISNSELSTWVTCQRKYYYEFDLALEPRVTGGALGRGILLHLALATYYETLKAIDERPEYASHPKSVIRKAAHPVAVTEARKVLMKALSDPGTAYEMDTVMTVDRLLKGYWDFYQGDDDWEIVAVEQGYDLDMEAGVYQYSLRLDLLVRIRTTGDIVLVDHKTAYNFWKQDDLLLNPQFPKYIGSLRANGQRVDYALLNQIRTRELKQPEAKDLFCRTEVRPTRAKVGNALREQVVGSRQIIEHRKKSLPEREASVLRILNKQVCDWCNAKPLCLSEFDGGDITLMAKTDYKPREYGYNSPTPEEL